MFVNVSVFQKGYVAAIQSWENDADNYKTSFIHVNEINTVKFIKEVCETVFVSATHSHEPHVVGNLTDGERFAVLAVSDKIVEIATKYGMTEEIMEICKFPVGAFVNDDDREDDEELETSLFNWLCYSFSWQFVGSSEYYQFRVYDKMEVWKIPQSLEKVEI